ncbi:sulfotransferase domain-containing protein [bacterium]|nr:sulfotransferase domain-containing protein [bacterium]
MNHAFHIGPSKTATTWLYENLRFHEQIRSSHTDTVHYYDLNAGKSTDWLSGSYEEITPAHKVQIELTPSYIRSVHTLNRILTNHPDAKIIFTMRNGYQRMLSHYWHEAKKNKVKYSLDDVLGHYDLYSTYVEPGMYADVLTWLVKCVPTDNIAIISYDSIKSNGTDVLYYLEEYLKIDHTSYPSAKKIINPARSKSKHMQELIKKYLHRFKRARKSHGKEGRELKSEQRYPYSISVSDEVASELKSRFDEDWSLSMELIEKHNVTFISP